MNGREAPLLFNRNNIIFTVLVVSLVIVGIVIIGDFKNYYNRNYCNRNYYNNQARRKMLALIQEQIDKSPNGSSFKTNASELNGNVLQGFMIYVVNNRDDMIYVRNMLMKTVPFFDIRLYQPSVTRAFIGNIDLRGVSPSGDYFWPFEGSAYGFEFPHNSQSLEMLEFFDSFEYIDGKEKMEIYIRAKEGMLMQIRRSLNENVEGGSFKTDMYELNGQVYYGEIYVINDIEDIRQILNIFERSCDIPILVQGQYQPKNTYIFAGGININNADNHLMDFKLHAYNTENELTTPIMRLSNSSVHDLRQLLDSIPYLVSE